MGKCKHCAAKHNQEKKKGGDWKPFVARESVIEVHYSIETDVVPLTSFVSLVPSTPCPTGQTRPFQFAQPQALVSLPFH